MILPRTPYVSYTQFDSKNAIKDTLSRRAVLQTNLHHQTVFELPVPMQLFSENRSPLQKTPIDRLNASLADVVLCECNQNT